MKVCLKIHWQYMLMVQFFYSQCNQFKRLEGNLAFKFPWILDQEANSNFKSDKIGKFDLL